MIDNPLELARGFGGLTGCEVRRSANVNGVQAAERSDETDTPQERDRSAGDLQRLNRGRRIMCVHENRARSVATYMN
jgi:hypothetical protein